MDRNEMDIKFLRQAVNLSAIGIRTKIGGPFGCIVVKND